MPISTCQRVYFLQPLRLSHASFWVGQKLLAFNGDKVSSSKELNQAYKRVKGGTCYRLHVQLMRTRSTPVSSSQASDVDDAAEDSADLDAALALSVADAADAAEQRAAAESAERVADDAQLQEATARERQSHADAEHAADLAARLTNRYTMSLRRRTRMHAHARACRPTHRSSLPSS